MGQTVTFFMASYIIMRNPSDMVASIVVTEGSIKLAVTALMNLKAFKP